MSVQDLQISSLLKDYHTGARRPREVIEQAYATAKGLLARNVWISLLPEANVLAQVAAVERRQAQGDALPLLGVPFAVKDNITVAGIETTAACPSFAFIPNETATSVVRLQEAGAILLGKTNLDQFATGLVGTRSPYGPCSSAFNPAYISGGSSSGSALSVAHAATSFALGTDTAGSGRVPAGFNNIFGLKPSRGLLSTYGVLPACRSLDCVSIFAGNAEDTLRVLEVGLGLDPKDPYSRTPPAEFYARTTLAGLRVGIPQKEQLAFFGDDEAARLYAAAVARVVALGARAVEVDFAPFHAAAQLLYSGAWVAERYAAVGEFLENDPQDANPIVSQIIRGGKNYSAVQAFEAGYRLQALSRAAKEVWETADVLLLPTSGSAYTHQQIEAEPIRHNSDLGYYTNFVNLLDMSGMALPAGFRSNGMPFGLTLLGQAFDDVRLVQLAAEMTEQGSSVGATGTPVAGDTPFLTRRTAEPESAAEDQVLLAVVGAHLRGQPLNSQLTELGAKFVMQTTTSTDYKLYALSDTVPAKPGLVQVSAGGTAIEVEVFSLSVAAFGHFVALVPAPLGIGKVKLADGRSISGFICENYAVSAATDISGHGGWRKFLTSK